MCSRLEAADVGRYDSGGGISICLECPEKICFLDAPLAEAKRYWGKRRAGIFSLRRQGLKRKDIALKMGIGFSIVKDALSSRGGR